MCDQWFTLPAVTHSGVISVLRSSITAFTSGWIINGISLWCKLKSSTGQCVRDSEASLHFKVEEVLRFCLWFAGLRRRGRNRTVWCSSARREPTGWCTDLRWDSFQPTEGSENKLHSTSFLPRVSHYLRPWRLITVACPVTGKGHGWLIFHTA